MNEEGRLMTVIWTDRVDSKFLRRYWLVAIVVIVIVGGALAAIVGARQEPSPSDQCVAKLAAHDVILGTPIVEHLPGGDVQVNGRF
jgi:hypothetical protein